MPEKRWQTPTLEALAVAALLFVQFWGVRTTNFGGVDEWLYLSLNRQGILSFPHANRPLTLLWPQPATWLSPYSFAGYWLVHCSYLAATGVLVLWLVRRLEPGDRGLAYLAGALTVAWAPLDMGRLATVQLTVGSGAVFGTVLALVLFVESWVRQRPALLVIAGLWSIVVARSYEGVAGLLIGAPLLLLFVPGPRKAARRLAFSLGWESLAGIGVVLDAWPFLVGGGQALYQSSVMRLDLHPWRLAVRLAHQFAFFLGPLVPRAIPLFLHAQVALAACVFVAGAWAAGLFFPPAESSASPRRLALLSLLGLALTTLAVGPLVTSPSIDTPTRTQVFGGFGIALFLACAIRVATRLLPAAGSVVAAPLAGAFVVALGTGHTLAMQEAWNRISYYGPQRDALARIVSEAPALKPHTLVLLVDESGTWPFSFSFRHAVSYLYGQGVVGHVLGADQLLYQLSADASGLSSVPWPIVQKPWRTAPDHYSYAEVVAFRLSAGHALVLLDEWNAERLHALPPGARYDPRARIEAPRPAWPELGVLAAP